MIQISILISLQGRPIQRRSMYDKYKIYMSLTTFWTTLVYYCNWIYVEKVVMNCSHEKMGADYFSWRFLYQIVTVERTTRFLVTLTVILFFHSTLHISNWLWIMSFCMSQVSWFMHSGPHPSTCWRRRHLGISESNFSYQEVKKEKTSIPSTPTKKKKEICRLTGIIKKGKKKKEKKTNKKKERNWKIRRRKETKKIF